VEAGLRPELGCLQLLAQGAAARRADSIERTPGYRADAPRVVHEDACTRACPASAPQRSAVAWHLAGRAVRHAAHTVLLGVAPSRARVGKAKA
jgi:hypothetical protein